MRVRCGLRPLTAPFVSRNYVRLTCGSRQLPTANCQLPTANCQLPTANCQLPTANCQLPTAEPAYVRYQESRKMPHTNRLIAC